MNPNGDKPSFLDRGTIIAFAIIMLFWLGWSKFMEMKYPSTPAKTTQTAVADGAANPVVTDPAVARGNSEPTTVKPSPDSLANAAATPETLTDFDDGSWSFKISSKGMGLRTITLKGYKNREGKPVVLGDVPAEATFVTSLLTSANSTELANVEPVEFAIEKAGENLYVGRGSLSGLQVEKTMKINSQTYSIETAIKVTGTMAEFKGLSTSLVEHQSDSTGGSMFAPTVDFESWYLAHDGSSTRKPVLKKDGLTLSQANVTAAALSTHYFALAIADRSPLIPSFESKTPANAEAVKGSLVHRPANQNDVFDVKYIAYAGPKSYSILSQVDEGLPPVIDYGMFSIIAKPILWLLKFIYSVLGNWGWAIIILTIIVRFIVLPFNLYSYKSMKVMQVIQPEMTRIREKYKDKPADQKLQMNTEIMDLMKRNKANPVGGCLPMLLQLPVFLALYQVLGQSIELYQAPFMWWIQDLSLRDPFFVLPILMAITMFVQQKITPTTMDPAQAKILLWMPVIFSVFMISLPSGLTLYIFVSTLFGVIQQKVFMRDTTPAATVTEAKA